MVARGRSSEFEQCLGVRWRTDNLFVAPHISPAVAVNGDHSWELASSSGRYEDPTRNIVCRRRLDRDCFQTESVSFFAGCCLSGNRPGYGFVMKQALDDRARRSLPSLQRLPLRVQERQAGTLPASNSGDDFI